MIKILVLLGGGGGGVGGFFGFGCDVIILFKILKYLYIFKVII